MDTIGTAEQGEALGTPARSRVRSWWGGRYGARLLVEIGICGGLLMIYRAIRMLNKTDLREAFRNAHEIVRLEQSLGMPFEDDIQRWLIEHELIIKGLNWYYILFHFPVAIALLLWLYLWHGDRYRGFRNLMAFVTFAALVIHLVYPLAPPRMMANFVDTMEAVGPNIYPPNALKGAANQLAAMPSLHFGWAMIEAIAVISVARSRWRWLILLHPALMTLAIIGTANHWWMDAAAAAVLILGAIAVWRVVAAWIGDRRWSWAKFRFETGAGIAQLEAFANEPTTQPCND
ncbi:MAG TPA: phosphatase PAP2 family protein [Ilumatobacter sp.]|nr:phosphatase PAP2 family protein [Ilumatobacter sp.]